MNGSYGIFLGNDQIGTAQVERQGLYYCFTCCCKLHSEVIYKVTIACNEHQVNLGVLIPMGDAYVLTKRIPVKSLGEGIPKFWITPRYSAPEGIHVDIYPEEPFRYIARLQKAYLEKRRERMGIVIPSGELLG